MRSNLPREVQNLIGARLAEARKGAKPTLSQEDLAGKLAAKGILLDRSAVSRIELGKRCVFDYELLAISQILKVETKWLLTGKP